MGGLELLVPQPLAFLMSRRGSPSTMTLTVSQPTATCPMGKTAAEPAMTATPPNSAGVPGPPPTTGRWDAIRRRYELQRRTLESIQHRFDIYGDVHRAPILGREGYSFCHPDHIRQILIAEAGRFEKRRFSLDFLGDGLLLSEGSVWRRRRRLVQPGFRSQALSRYGAIIEEEIEGLAERIERSPVVEVRSLMMDLALRVVSRTLFGQPFRGDGRRVARAIRFLNRAAILPELLPRWAPSPMRALSAHMQRIVDREVFALLDEAQERPGSLLYDLQHPADPSSGLTRTELRDEAVTLFVAGHETTALALTWTLYLVAHHPHVEADIVREVRGVAPTGVPRASQVEALTHCERAFKEAMRLYPPAYVVPRVCVDAVNVGGAPLEPGDEAWLWLYVMHRDARWYQMPTRFIPERFAPGGDNERNPHTYAPFGAGTRVCIGRSFAMLEGVLTIACLLSRFHFELLDMRPLRPLPRITLVPSRPLYARVTPRR